MNTNYMQLLPTVASTGYTKVLLPAQPEKFCSTALLKKSALCQSAFQTRRILKFGVYIEKR